MEIVTLDPTFEERTTALGRAPALATLEGATVGLLSNGKTNVAPFLDEVEAILRREHGVAEVRRLRKPNMSAPAPREVMGELAGCDAAFSAIGD